VTNLTRLSISEDPTRIRTQHLSNPSQTHFRFVYCTHPLYNTSDTSIKSDSLYLGTDNSCRKIHCESKLLSGFPWPIIFQIGNSKSKLLTECKSVTQKVLFDSAVLAALVSGRKYVCSNYVFLMVFADSGMI
jgi:hypothetical protein